MNLSIELSCFTEILSNSSYWRRGRRRVSVTTVDKTQNFNFTFQIWIPENPKWDWDWDFPSEFWQIPISIPIGILWDSGFEKYNSDLDTHKDNGKTRQQWIPIVHSLAKHFALLRQTLRYRSTNNRQWIPTIIQWITNIATLDLRSSGPSPNSPFT